MNNYTESEVSASPRQIVIGSLAALGVAAVLLVTAVLPAEFNIDPLGTGKLLGITGMSEAQQVGALNLQPNAYHQDSYQIVLAPYESVEYKYRLEEGATLLFDWRASGDLVFDMHSEQDGVDPYEYSPSFDQGSDGGVRGSFTAPFSGVHGWFWENRSSRDVTLELTTAGFYSAATEYGQNYQNEKAFSEAK
ncbi:MAG: hypothetical protein WDZ30_08515 [Cellvibrionaceae bacterium]